MDRGESQLTGSGVGEPVRHVRGADDDVAGLNDHSLVAKHERGLPGIHDEDLGVRMRVERRTGPRARVDQDDRERDVGVVRADELVAVVSMWQRVERDDGGPWLRVRIGHEHIVGWGDLSRTGRSRRSGPAPSGP